MLLPAVAARCWTNRIGTMMGVASGIGLLSCFAGLLLSYHRNLPSGPAIVMVAGGLYGLSLAASTIISAIRTRMVGSDR
jgi:zinc/manganese transport system permease protein